MLHDFLKKVQELGLEITTVYDIGAWNGNWSKGMKKDVIPNANFILFEANSAYKEVINATGFLSFIGVALSNPGRTYVDFYNGTDTGDSYYKETSEHYSTKTSVKLPCITLDSLKAIFGIPTPQFIKIDTQGSELDVLAGAENFIRDVDLIYTECPIVCYNEGAPKIQDYLDFFKERGFIPIDIFEVHRGEETLLQLDIMFMRKETKDRFFGSNKNINPLA